MSLKNLNATKIHKILKEKTNNKKVKRIFNLFEKNLYLKEDFAVAVSGGPDSLALSFLSKVYALKYRLNAKFFIVDHKLRKGSAKEAKKVKNILKNLNIQSEILSWKGPKPKKNIQATARKIRYDLLFQKCKKYNINNLLLGHHLDDLFENFFIRLVRGSGLKGLVSLDKKKQINQFNLLRPLLELDKSDLLFISKYVYNFFISDPTNNELKYTRVRIRNLLSNLKEEGFDKNKLFLTIKNLKKTNQALSYYVEKNKKLNSFFNKKNNKSFLSQNFFNKPYEIKFRSMMDLVKLVGGKDNTVRGTKIDNILIKIENNTLNKVTLGGCIIKKVNQTVIISKEY